MMCIKGTGAYMVKDWMARGKGEGVVSEWLSGYEDGMHTLARPGNTQRRNDTVNQM